MPTINVQAVSVGAVAVDAFAPDFSNPACTVFTNGSSSGWGQPAGQKYFAANDSDEFTVITTADYTDVEVTTWARKAEVFLRYDQATGKGFRFRWNEDTVGIGIYPTYNIVDPPGTWDAEPPGTGQNIFEDGYGLDMTTIPGWVANDPNRTWTFGMSGLDVYVKMSGVEVHRFRQPYHLVPGKIAFRNIDDPSGGYGLSNVIVTALTPVSLISDVANNIFDPRDAGFKELPTTGSITVGTPTLTVASATGYEIGDPIIVEIGTETGLGLRGTIGVGGTWPSLSYANQAAMDADTTQVDGKWAFALDTGLTKWWDDDPTQAWSRSTYGTGDYYFAKCLPIALTATITNIVGNVITLDTNAGATATNANVYYDCIEGLRFFSDIEYNWDDARTFTIPAGEYAVNGRWDISSAISDECEVYGQGIDATTLFSPDGALESGIAISSASISLHDLAIIGNFGTNGYHLNPYGSVEDISRGVPPFNFGKGVGMGNGDCYNVRSGDHGGQEFHAQYVSSVRFTNCEAFHTEGTKIYLADWAFQIADSEAVPAGAIIFTDCTYTSPILNPGFECFRSNGVHFVRCHSTNGIFASNSSGNFLIDECTFIMEEGNEDVDYITDYGESVDNSGSFNNAIININSNIQPPDTSMLLGGRIRNPTIIIEGYSNVALKHAYRGLIIVNGDNPNITIEAVPPWPDRACDAPLVNGYIYNDTWTLASDAVGNDGAFAVNSDGVNTVISGLRVVGTEDPAWGNFKSDHLATVSDCVFDGGLHGSITGSNNITNAQFGIVCQANSGPPTRVGVINYTHVLRRTKVVSY